jgi:hypothetical protein
MSKIVLDIATLRAAKRLLFHKGPRHDNGRFVDLDISALAALVEGICFSDEILVPNLGHQSFNAITEPFGTAVVGAELSDTQRSEIARLADNWLSGWSKVEDFIVLLGSHPLYSVLQANSEDYLILQALGVRDKYQSQVVQWVRALRSYDAALDGLPELAFGDKTGREYRPPASLKFTKFMDEILHEPKKHLSKWLRGELFNYFDNEKFTEILGGLGLSPMMFGTRHEIPEMRDENGRPSMQARVGSEMLSFCANLVWTVFRTKCYCVYSRERGITYMPHPLRARLAGFSEACEYGPEDTEVYLGAKPGYYVRSYISCLDKVYQEALDATSHFADTTLIRIPFSPVLPYVIKKAKRREKIIEVAYDVRGTRGARDLRARLNEFEHELRTGEIRAAIGMRNELERLVHSLRRHLGLEAYQGPKIGLSIGGVVSVDLPIPGPRIVTSLVSKTDVFKPRLLLLRDVFDALAAASSLGALYKVLYDPDEYRAHSQLVNVLRARMRQLNG